MKQSIWVWWLGLAIVLGAIASATWYFSSNPTPPEPEAPAAPTPAPAPVVEAPASPAAAPTAPAAPAEPPLPPLDASDEDIREALASSIGQEPVERQIVDQNVVRRLVATADNLPRSKVAMQIRAFHPAPGEFQVSGEEDALTLSPENYPRYRSVVRAFEAADTKALVALYRRWQPLFQQAYDELGNPPQTFEARLTEVIDDLLATPDVDGPIKLIQPNVFYQFADPELEALSAGQKLLLRMGPENAAAVKAKLREIRAALQEAPVA